MEHTKTTTISVLQTFLNTMNLFLHDPKDRREVAEDHVCSRNQWSVLCVKNNFFLDNTETGPVLAITQLQESGCTLCKCPVVPEIVILNEEDVAPQEPLQKVACKSDAKWRAQRVVSTPVHLPTMELTSSQPMAYPKKNPLRLFGL